jgi:hypothetical protein
MRHQSQRLMTLLVALTCAAVFYPAHAQDPNVHVYLAHAAPGRNISSTTNPAYPVDIAFGPLCVAKGLSFGEIVGPFTGPPGTYVVKVSVSSAVNPCGNASVFSATVSLSAGSTSMGIVNLNSSNQVSGQIFAINLAPVPFGQSRIIIANTTHSTLTGTLTVDDTMSSPISANVGAGSVLALPVAKGLYTGNIYLAGLSTLAAGPQEIDLASRNVYIFVLAGSTTNNSVQLIGPKVIRDVF